MEATARAASAATTAVADLRRQVRGLKAEVVELRRQRKQLGDQISEAAASLLRAGQSFRAGAERLELASGSLAQPYERG